MSIAITGRKPSLSLAPYVESYWMGQFNVLGDDLFSQQVVPNGCIELIVHLSNDHCALTKRGGPHESSPPYTLMGIYKQPYVVRFFRRVSVFGIRFFPDGFRNIFGVPPRLFNDTYEDGIDVVGTEFDVFCGKIREAPDDQRRTAIADGMLTRLLDRNRRQYDITGMAMQWIRQRQGMVDFETLKDTMPISLRQLQREFRNQYGMKISDYIRLSRLNAINKYMRSQPSSLTELAYALQFTDQSHFIREFRHFVGRSPRRFIRHQDEFIVNAV
jgi:AraC-like DNA-binding protein